MLFIYTHIVKDCRYGVSLLLLYVCIALSDVLDGLLALGGGTQPFLGPGRCSRRYCLYQSESRCCGLVRVCRALGCRWLSWVALSPPQSGPAADPHGRLVEDRAGKAAGVIYYLLVGAVALELAVEGQRPLVDCSGGGRGVPLHCSCSASAAGAA